MKSRCVRLLVHAALTAALSACGSEDTSPAPVEVREPAPPPVTVETAPVVEAPVQPVVEPVPVAPEPQVATPLAMVSAPADSELGLAQTAFRAGRFAEARAHYAAANAALEEAFSEEELYEACEGEEPNREACTRLRANPETRAAFRCAYGLSTMATPRLDEDALRLAYAQVAACDAVHRGVSAMLRGRPVEAALHTRLPFPAPFAHLVVSEDARTLAEAYRGDTRPSLPSLRAATQAVEALAKAGLGMTATCDAPRGGADPEVLDAHGMTDAIEYLAPYRPFPELAFIDCRYDGRDADFDSSDSFGDGMSIGRVYVIAREENLFAIASVLRTESYTDCGYGSITGQTGEQVIRQDGRVLYSRTSTFGGTWGDEGAHEEESTTRTTLCDIVSGRCGTTTVSQVRTTTNPVHWRARLVVVEGQVRLEDVSGDLPAVQQPLQAGVPLDTFLGTFEASTVASYLVPPSLDARGHVETDDCVSEIADTDGQTNVRAEPSTRSALAGSIANGTAIHITAVRGRWLQIDQPERGWVWSPNVARRCP